mmetsp:Transcript_31357/g.91852  ORF Transcript_31357/g.91852 Transcript_31357/m.91852 type:complete len:201 (+) Transcript_31357:1424-2026(+)
MQTVTTTSLPSAVSEVQALVASSIESTVLSPILRRTPPSAAAWPRIVLICSPDWSLNHTPRVDRRKADPKFSPRYKPNVRPGSNRKSSSMLSLDRSNAFCLWQITWEYNTSVMTPFVASTRSVHPATVSTIENRSDGESSASMLNSDVEREDDSLDASAPALALTLSRMVWRSAGLKMILELEATYFGKSFVTRTRRGIG